MPEFEFSTDAFGDSFTLSALCLPREAQGYALQRLDTDQLFDRLTGNFLPIRTPALQALFASFDLAHAAAVDWASAHCPPPAEHRIAIVPASYDAVLQRHILIYGVLRSSP